MASDEHQELEIPDGIGEADVAIEVLRAWVADGALHVIFDPETFRDSPGEWGRMLADISGHIANAIAMQGNLTAAEAAQAISEAYDHGLVAQGRQRTGKLKGRTKH
jgi:Domain of unknown function (DUF5076)